jgi:hypothetical protein
MRNLTALLILFLISFSVSSKDKVREFYSLTVYRIKNKAQEEKIDSYLKAAYLPALHRAGRTSVGVFKPVASDTSNYGKVIYVLTTYKSLDEYSLLSAKLLQDPVLLSAGNGYLKSAYNEAPYDRIETVLMQAFVDHPALELPALKGDRRDRIYELRSYEGPTEKLYQSKVKMFNVGDEIGLFKRLGFNAVFYAEVLAGSRMPNLVYLTTFENKASRDEHWKAFVEDPQWKKLISMEEYKNTVSKADIWFLSPTDYSDY